MAAAIEKTIDVGGTLVAEAGTGIGKTLSYLVPVLKGRERTVISTGTKTLQDQLYFRDLPMVKKALGSTLTTALLKGRANYLCLYRMEQARKDGRLPVLPPAQYYGPWEKGPCRLNADAASRPSKTVL